MSLMEAGINAKVNEEEGLTMNANVELGPDALKKMRAASGVLNLARLAVSRFS